MTERFQTDHAAVRQADEEFRAGSRFAFGLLCGALVGGALGLLLAPKTGAETRHQIRDSAERAKQRAADAYDGASRVVTDAVDRSRKAVEAGKQAYADARSAPAPDQPAGVSVS